MNITKKHILISLFTLIIGLIAGARLATSEYNKEVKLDVLLKTDTTSIGQRIIYPNFENDEVSVLKVTIPPGKGTGWHKHTFPVFAYILKGSLTVELENNIALQFAENASFSEVINTYHNGTNLGNEDVVLIAFFMGEKGKPLSARKDTVQTLNGTVVK
ncbi:MAG: cupin domain-containing protein [Desulfobulbaceae bacterium]|jgi:quercetin dioxygenase-like cupin family protein|nr:cupin domain-containing protein [Desulfobulbaceae bacterium]